MLLEIPFSGTIFVGVISFSFELRISYKPTSLPRASLQTKVVPFAEVLCQYFTFRYEVHFS